MNTNSNTSTSPRADICQTFMELIDFLHPRLSIQDCRHALCILKRLGLALDAQDLKDNLLLRRAVLRVQHSEYAAHAFNDLLWKVFESCGRNEGHEIGVHFRTFTRLHDELNVPVPPDEDIRAQLEEKWRRIAEGSQAQDQTITG